jgi:ABC-type bacteriocin/lantibiotic exporter with double-glycine peptidase domain
MATSFLVEYMLLFHRVSYTKKHLNVLLQSSNQELPQISHIFDSYKIPNLSVSIKPDKLCDMPLPAIAHIYTGNHQATFTIITKYENEYVTFFNQDKVLVKEHISSFCEEWLGTLLLVLPNKDSVEENYLSNKKAEKVTLQMKGMLNALYLSIAIIFFYSLFFLKITDAIYFNFSVFGLLALGLYVSVTLLRKEYGKENELLEKS